VNVLVAFRAEISGAVKFIFQPAHTSFVLTSGEEGGAFAMIKAGVLRDPQPDALIALDMVDGPAGRVSTRMGTLFAASYKLHVVIRGKAAFGGYPWTGSDPTPTAAQILLALQVIPSRQSDLTRAPVLITVGTISAGTVFNQVPEAVTLDGIVRLLDMSAVDDVIGRIKRTVTYIAASAGQTADVSVEPQLPVLANDPALFSRMMASLKRPGVVAGVGEMPWQLGSVNTAFYAQNVPTFYASMGAGEPPDRSGLVAGTRALASMVIDYLSAPLSN